MRKRSLVVGAIHELPLRLLIASCVVLAASCRPHAPQTSDPRSPDEKAWEAAHDFEDAARMREAKAAYQEMCGKKPPYVRACFDFARVMFQTATPNEARTVAAWTLLTFPDSGLTVSLIKQLGESYRKNREVDAGIQALFALEKKMQKSDAVDSLLYEIAGLYRETKDTYSEVKTLSDIVARFNRWNSQVWDDSIWRLAEICREENRFLDEILWLEKLLREKESSRLIGSYNSPYHDDTMQRLGELYLSEKRYGDAYRVFIELSQFKTSRMNDDGLLGAARVEIERGNLKNACRLLHDAVREDGSVKREAASLAASKGCGP